MTDIHRRVSRRLTAFLSNSKSADRVAAEIIQLVAATRPTLVTGQLDQGMGRKRGPRSTLAEREARWAQWPQGDAGDAIDFACDHAKEPVFFLEDWRADRANEWPEYVRWLNVQRDGARAASDAHPQPGPSK